MSLNYLRTLLCVGTTVLAVSGVSMAQQNVGADDYGTDLERELERAVEAELGEEWFEGAESDRRYDSEIELALEEAIEEALAGEVGRGRYDRDLEYDDAEYQDYWESRYGDYDYDTYYYDYYDWFGAGFEHLDDWGSGEYGYDDGWNYRGYE